MSSAGVLYVRLNMSTPKDNTTLSLKESLKEYWPNLIGFSLFPFLYAQGSQHIPQIFIHITFFVSFIFAVLPVMRKQAPYSFWIFGLGLWVMCGVLAIIASMILALINS